MVRLGFCDKSWLMYNTYKRYKDWNVCLRVCVRVSSIYLTDLLYFLPLLAMAAGTSWRLDVCVLTLTQGGGKICRVFTWLTSISLWCPWIDNNAENKEEKEVWECFILSLVTGQRLLRVLLRMVPSYRGFGRGPWLYSLSFRLVPRLSHASLCHGSSSRQSTSLLYSIYSLYILGFMVTSEVNCETCIYISIFRMKMTFHTKTSIDFVEETWLSTTTDESSQLTDRK